MIQKNFFDQIYLHTTFANTATTTATNYFVIKVLL